MPTRVEVEVLLPRMLGKVDGIEEVVVPGVFCSGVG